MKVLFIGHDATRTGAPILLFNLLKWIRQKNAIDFHVLLKNGGDLTASYESIAPVQVLNWDQALSTRHTAETQAWLNEIKARLHAEKFDLVYSNTVTNGDVLEFLAELDCPIITHVHELEFWIQHRVEKSLISKMLTHTDMYIAVSQAVRDNLIHNLGIAKDRIDLVYGAIPEELVKPHISSRQRQKIKQELGIPAQSFIVGASGTTDWRKAPDLFIQLALLVSRHKTSLPIHFLWVGGAHEGLQYAELQYTLKKIGLTSRVHFIGQRENPMTYFALFDVFALVSREDPFPIVNIEAAALEVPIVCFESVGGSPELVEQGCGYAVPYLDLQQMAQKIIALQADPGLRTKMGRKGAAIVAKAHTTPVAAHRIVTIIKATQRRFAADPARRRRYFEVASLPHAKLFDALQDATLTPDQQETVMLEIVQRLNYTSFFVDLYNLASYMQTHGDKHEAETILTMLAERLDKVNPALAGRACFKLAEAAKQKGQQKNMLERCLALYPEHGKAHSMLQSMNQRSITKRGTHA